MSPVLIKTVRKHLEGVLLNVIKVLLKKKRPRFDFLAAVISNAFSLQSLQSEEGLLLTQARHLLQCLDPPVFS